MLYAASNLGSFAALLAYPLAIESLLTLRDAGLDLVGRLCGARAADRGRRLIAARGDGRVAHAAAIGARRRGATAPSWTALAAIPAGLVIAVTAYISTDVAAAPLLWVLPLALYLLTFVAVFRDKPWFSHELVVQARAVPGRAARDHAAGRRPRATGSRPSRSI